MRVERLSREAQEISGRALDGKARPGDAGQLQERRRQIGRLVDETADPRPASRAPGQGPAGTVKRRRAPAR